MMFHPGARVMWFEVVSKTRTDKHPATVVGAKKKISIRLDSGKRKAAYAENLQLIRKELL